MKKKFIFIVAALAVFGLSIAVVAYTRSNTANSNAAVMSDCCKGKDSCPMKSGGSHSHKAGDHAEKQACCDNCDCSCCKEGAEACPMKTKKADNAEAVATDTSATTETKDKTGCGCGCSCCGAKAEKNASV